MIKTYAFLWLVICFETFLVFNDSFFDPCYGVGGTCGEFGWSVIANNMRMVGIPFFALVIVVQVFQILRSRKRVRNGTVQTS